MIEIKEIKTNKDKRLFAKFPVTLYKDCPYYVPSLREDDIDVFNPKKNHNLKENKIKGFLCYKDGKLVGRIAGLINKKENEIWNTNFVRFSRFDAIEDIEVFKALLSAVAQFGKENGITDMHGPWGFNDTDREGMLTFGFDKRSTYATNYSYPYYFKFMEELGFEPESKWIEKTFTIPETPYERILSIAEKLKNRLKVVDVAETMSVRKILKLYGAKFFETMNQAYKNLDAYVPIEGKARDNVLKQFATIVNRKYISVLVDQKGEVASFAIVLPSICKPLVKHGGKLFPTGFIGVLNCIANPKELEMGLIGIRDEYKNTGINAIMIARIMKNIVESNIERIESNPMLENNLSIQQQWKFAENEIIKTRQTYKKSIEEFLS
ncbi:MAG: hypothetical protein IJA88_01310 [Clostridia bacterium]|nr:hypothetical protein [Clostridia bacterium]